MFDVSKGHKDSEISDGRRGKEEGRRWEEEARRPILIDKRRYRKKFKY